MKTTHSFAIDFLIRRCKDDKQQALIYARITIDEDRKEVSLKERINAADWDPVAFADIVAFAYITTGLN